MIIYVSGLSPKKKMNNTIINKSIQKTNLDWSLIQSELKSKLGTNIYDSWIKKIDLVEEFNNYILLSVSTRFIRDWITSRYLDQILQTIKKHKKQIIRIEFKIIENKEKNEKKSTFSIKKEEIDKVSFIKDSYLQYNRIDPNKRFTNFFIGSSNKLLMRLHLKLLKIPHIITLYTFMVVSDLEKLIF